MLFRSSKKGADQKISEKDIESDKNIEMELKDGESQDQKNEDESDAEQMQDTDAAIEGNDQDDKTQKEEEK